MGIVDLIFPKSCLGCGNDGSYVCVNCIKKMPKLKQICAACAKPSIDGATHVKCLKPWGMSGLVHLWPYGGVIRKAILGLKYKYATEIAKELSGYIVSEIKGGRVLLPRKTVLLPIPLHKRRENWRGFNQVEEIGKIVSDQVGWKFESDVLIRKELRTPQTKLKRDERKRNIVGAFAISTNKKQFMTKNQQLILFDDVYTTGSTLKEAVKVLRRSGSGEVFGFTIAR